MTRRAWYEIEARASEEGGSAVELLVYDEIGAFGITASDFARDLRDAGPVDTINLRINSPGGSVFDALAIYNTLKRSSAKKVVTIDGVAASAASMIAMAGDDIVMPENAHFLLHHPSALVLGTADDMRAMARDLDAISASAIGMYTGKSGMKPEKVRSLMDEDRLIPASEAIELGLADRLTEAVKIAAKFDLNQVYCGPPTRPSRRESEMPEPAATPPNNTDTNVVDIEAVRREAYGEEREKLMAIMHACNDAGFPALAEGFIQSGVSLDTVSSRLEMCESIRLAAEIAPELKDLSEELVPQVAAGKIAARAAREKMVAARAAASAAPEIHSTTVPGDAAPSAKIDPSAIFRNYNAKRS